MDIKTFCEQYGQRRRPVDDVLGKWRIEQVDSFLNNLVASGVLLSDLAIGDGLRDQISPALLEGFTNVMHEKADTYNEVREILHKKLALGDKSVDGLVNKIKGQIGENIFVKEVGPHARLAASGSQEGWDVAVDHTDGTQYVQVKMYKDADGVLRHMRDVQEKVETGVITDGEKAVNHIDFAVPSDIFEEVESKLNDPTLRNINVISIDMTAGEAAQIVEEGVDNVSRHALEHFFGELLGDVLSAGSLHAVVNGFLMYKGAKDFEEATADAVLGTGISAAGISAAMVTESILWDHLALSGPVSFLVGTGTRAFLSRVARSRWRFADFLECSNQHLEGQIRILRTAGL